MKHLMKGRVLVKVLIGWLGLVKSIMEGGDTVAGKRGGRGWRC